jgi:pyridinium-3,5-biscarboxylic acid mononucleotide synthase
VRGERKQQREETHDRACSGDHVEHVAAEAGNYVGHGRKAIGINLACMDGWEVRALLGQVATGDVSVERAAELLAAGPLASGLGFADLGFARLDTHRGLRTGDPEVVFAEGKSTEQTLSLLAALSEAPGERPALVTRVPVDAWPALREAFPDALVDETGRCAAVGHLPEPSGTVCVVSAGTSDAPVAAEAAFVSRAYGANVTTVSDVGVAGIHRLLAVRDELEAADCLVVVAGMDGALPSVVGGLTGVPLLAVPTSVGYGASFGGVAALLTMLNSCAPGVAVCNIDNGFGAGVFAARVARRDKG